MSKRCTVAWDTSGGVRCCELTLADEANIAAALAAARRVLGLPEAEGRRATTGIYGRLLPRDHVPVDGDRIELYRALQLDPRARRRARLGRPNLPQRDRPRD